MLATGSAPFVPPIPGTDAAGAFVYRTLDDLDAIRAWASECRTGAVVGGGLLGLEAANALRLLGLHTTVVEFAPRLMAVQLDDGGGRALRRHVEALGLDVRTGAAAAAVRTSPDGRVVGLSFAEGDDLDAELVVFAAGIRPRDQLGRDAGLAIGERGGVIIDDALRHVGARRVRHRRGRLPPRPRLRPRRARSHGWPRSSPTGSPAGPPRSPAPTCRRRSSCSVSTSPAPATRTPRATTSSSPTPPTGTWQRVVIGARRPRARRRAGRRHVAVPDARAGGARHHDPAGRAGTAAPDRAVERAADRRTSPTRRASARATTSRAAPCGRRSTRGSRTCPASSAAPRRAPGAGRACRCCRSWSTPGCRRPARRSSGASAPTSR